MSLIRETAVVVGGAGALGSVIVARLLQEGLHVIAVGRSGDALARLAEAQPDVGLCVADLAEDAAIQSLKKAVGEATVRMVVHAPGLDVAGGVRAVSPDALAAAVNVKAGGMLRLVRGVEHRLVRGSRLVGIGGHYGLEPSAYAATAGVGNAALISLMRQLNLAYGPDGITAHLVAPGPADTERLRRVAASRAQREGVSVTAVLDAMRAESAIGAFTTPEQVAWAVALLLAPEADALAGSPLLLDAGRRRGLP